MIEQLKTIRAGLETATCYSMLGVDAHSVQLALTALTQLEAMVGEQSPKFWYRPVGNDGLYEGPVHHNSVGGKMLRDEKPGEWVPLFAGAAPVAQQPQAEAMRSIEQERKEAERQYIIPAFNYPEAPIGSRDWVLYWAGWLARSTAFKAPQQAEAVPPGYVLVPVEPTEAMLLSARDWSATKYGKPIGDDAAKGCWGAMVAAAIAQQKGQP